MHIFDSGFIITIIIIYPYIYISFKILPTANQENKTFIKYLGTKRGQKRRGTDKKKSLAVAAAAAAVAGWC